MDSQEDRQVPSIMDMIQTVSRVIIYGHGKISVAKQWLKPLPSGTDLSEEQAKGRNAALNMLRQQVKAGSGFLSQQNHQDKPTAFPV